MGRLDASRDGFARRVVDLARATAHQDAGRIQTSKQVVEALAVDGGSAAAHATARVHRAIFVYASIRIRAVAATLAHAALSVIAQTPTRFTLRSPRFSDAALSFSFASRDSRRVASSCSDTSIFSFFTTLDFIRERQIG